VWYIWDERARDREVLHLQWGVLYKSGVYALKVTCLTLGGLYSVFYETESGVIHSDRCTEVSRRHSRYLQARLVRHSNAERWRNGYAEP
jgi:hypothetical protein